MKNNPEFMGDAIDFLMDHPEFTKEKFLKTNPQLKEVVEKAIKEREDRKKEICNKELLNSEHGIN
jgi:hypothetical protein